MKRCGDFRSILLFVLSVSLLQLNSEFGLLLAADKATDADKSLAEVLPRISPTEPEAALKTFRLKNGFRLELLAAEPLVMDPVAMQYDENGLAYVIEMSDYPYSDKSKDVSWAEQQSLPIGRVRILKDNDGDGLFDESFIFADKLSWPTGLAFWKGGVFVSATPDVWYFKDTDGDHQADIKQKVFTGFRKYNVQAVMNNLKWGLDHKIYGAGSSNGGDIRATDNPQQKPVRLGRRDFRFDVQTKQFEAISGGARFGNTFDDWGNRFICNIRNPIRHPVLPARYLARNKYLPVTTAIVDVAEAGDALPVYRASPPEPWRIINAERLANKTGRKSPRSESNATGFVTSSSGITLYRGSAYPKAYYGNAFIGEVAGNLVMHYKLTAESITFRGTRVHEKSEFIASTDNWFRPVNFVNAPDGTLHLLDMYRETIEHPWSIPDDIKAHLDLRSGTDRGRVYRIAPPEYAANYQKPPQPKLGSASIAELVELLNSPNCWWRETSHRLLFERQDKSAVPRLRQLLHNGVQPVARLHALWSLEGLAALQERDITTALQDESLYVRKHAVQLAESRLQQSTELLKTVLRMADDDAIEVRFQVAFSLGEVKTDRAIDALYNIARRDSNNEWVRTAVLSSLSELSAPFLVKLIADRENAINQQQIPLLAQLANVVGVQNQQEEIMTVLAALAARNALTVSDNRVGTTETLVALGNGLQRSRSSLLNFAKDKQSAAGKLILSSLEAAEQSAVADDIAVPNRQLAIQLIGCTNYSTADEALSDLLNARQPQEIQEAAIDALTNFSDAEVAELLLEKYPAITPSGRSSIVNKLLTRSVWIIKLLDAIEQRKVSAAQVSALRRTLLMKSRNTIIKQQATRLFAGDIPGPRKDVIAHYQPALSLAGDMQAGQIVFKRECLNCHKLGTAGHEVGPNLATVKNRTSAEIMLHLLDPNREVSPNYLEYIVQDDKGRVFTGIIANETPASITLRKAENKEQTILRANIEEIKSSGKSLMPEGLEKKIKLQEMADLLTFIRSLGK